MFQSAATKYVNPLSEYPYKFTSELTGKDVVEDDHVEFKIELDEEDGDVKWFKDGQEIQDSESNMFQLSTSEQEPIANMAHNVLSTLKFVGPERISANQLMPTDRGHYSCQFSNEVGNAETVMFLRIEHSPVVVHQHNKVAYDLGETAVINCQMQAFPAPRFDWTFGNSILQSDRQFYETNTTSIGEDVYEGELRINTVVETSYGDYICKGINSMGAKRTIIKLQPKGKPERPQNIRPVETGFNFITLGWDEGFNGGYNDTMFTIQYRRQDEEMPKYEDCRHRNPCNITGVEQHSQYYIKVKASNILGESKYSVRISCPHICYNMLIGSNFKFYFSFFTKNCPARFNGSGLGP